MTNELYVTLESADNSYLPFPCKGWLELFEIGSDGSIIKGVFRQDPAPEDRTPCFSRAPVQADKPIFSYDWRQTKFRKI